MKNHILILLIFATSLLSIHTHAQNTQTNPGLTTDNSFGILELFDGKVLFENRKHFKEKGQYYFVNYVPFNDAEKLVINKSKDGKSITINQGIQFQVTIYKTKKPGVFEHSKRYKHHVGKYSFGRKVDSIKFHENGSLEIHEKDGSRLFEIAGIGLKMTWGSGNSYYHYYETEEEHKKTSGTGNSYPRIISLGETALAGNSSFRFLAGEQTNIKITTVPTVGKGKFYVTLYDIDGEVIKEVAGRETLTLSHVIPVNGFYYISTMVEKGDQLKITLEED